MIETFLQHSRFEIILNPMKLMVKSMIIIRILMIMTLISVTLMIMLTMTQITNYLSFACYWHCFLPERNDNKKVSKFILTTVLFL